MFFHLGDRHRESLSFGVRASELTGLSLSGTGRTQVMDSSYSLERFQHGASRRFMTAIETLCHTCATQAPDAAAHHHLATSCAALKEAAVAVAPPDEL